MTLESALRAVAPSYWLTKGAGWLATVKTPIVKNFLIRQFIKFYRVNMESALRQTPDQFVDFQDFFTRELKPAARPIHGDDRSIVSPVDGTIAISGHYDNNTLIQYKSTTTNLFNLTQCDRIRDSGQYAIIYLSPKDYHRVHSPVQATLLTASRIGGSRRSVNPANHASIDGLYERNVRVNCYLRTHGREMLLVMVGAMIVSSVRTRWDEYFPLNQSEITFKPEEPQTFQPGEEMARFCLGSTVILVMPEGMGKLYPLTTGQPVKLGEEIGVIHA